MRISLSKSNKLRLLVLFCLLIVGGVPLLLALVETGDWNGLMLNLGTEVVGAAITFVLIDWFVEERLKIEAEKQEREQDKKRLIQQLGHRNKGTVLDAIDGLRATGQLTDGSLNGISLFEAPMEGVDLDGARLQKVNFQRAHLRKASLNLADLKEANFGRCDLEKAYMRFADLCGANLSYANMKSCYLRFADLRGTYSPVVQLQEAILMDARLHDAILIEANLEGAYCMRASFENARLTKAVLNRASLLAADFRGATLIGARLDGADLRGTDLCGANLKDASLLYCNLDGSSLIEEYEFLRDELNITENRDGRTQKHLKLRWLDAWVSAIKSPLPIFDEETIMPNGERWTEHMDVAQFINPEHESFWYLNYPSLPHDIITKENYRDKLKEFAT